MSPQSASRGPVERGLVERIHCPDTEQLAASVGGLGRKNYDFCPIFGIPSWLMPLRDRSGQRWPPSGLPYVVSDRSLFKVHWNLSQPQVHTQRSHSNEAGP